jgi:transcriptional regulator with XRE-family HTH domain
MREIRKGVHLSQMELHKKSGLDRTFISDLERGIQCPSLRTVLRVAKALDIAPWNLIRRTVDSALFAFPTSDEQ